MFGYFCQFYSWAIRPHARLEGKLRLMLRNKIKLTLCLVILLCQDYVSHGFHENNGRTYGFKISSLWDFCKRVCERLSHLRSFDRF